MQGSDREGPFRTVISGSPGDEVDAEIVCPAPQYETDYGYIIRIPDEAHGRKFMTLDAAQNFIEKPYKPRVGSAGPCLTIPSRP